MAEDRPSGSDIPSRIGRAMLFAAWVVGLALLVLLFQRFMDQGENPNRDLALNLDSQGRAQVVLARNRAGHYVASGRINGEPVVFMIDTGATDVALPLDLARRLDLPWGRRASPAPPMAMSRPGRPSSTRSILEGWRRAGCAPPSCPTWVAIKSCWA
jgi:predicted aspartyl protease